MDGRHGSAVHLLECRRLYVLPGFALIPWAPGIHLAVLPFTSIVVEELIDKLGSGSNFADAEDRFSHTFKSERERAHVRDLPPHEKLHCVLCAGIKAKIY